MNEIVPHWILKKFSNSAIQEYGTNFGKTRAGKLIYYVPVLTCDADYDIMYAERTQMEAKRMTTTITARIDSEKKREAEAIFNDIGMTLSGAINVFINEVVMYQGIPFQLRRRSSAANRLEEVMDETDAYCREHHERLTHSEVFGHAREIANAGRRVHA